MSTDTPNSKPVNAWEAVVSEITKIKAMQESKAKAIEYWGEDIPTTLLFSILGGSFAETFQHLSKDEQSHIFRTIENSMTSGDDELRAYVATGFLEATHSRACKETELMSELNARLGVASKAYLDEWEKWLQGR